MVEKSHVMCHSGQIGLGPCNLCRCVNSNVHKGWHRDDFMTWKHFPQYWPLFIGNPPIPPHKYLAMLNFDVFFVIRLNYCWMHSMIYNDRLTHWGSLITKFMGPKWGLSGADRTQMGPMLAPWTLLSGLGDSIRRHRSGSVLVQVMAFFLTAPSHYINQCWLTIKVFCGIRLRAASNCTSSAHGHDPFHVCGDYVLKVTVASHKVNWPPDTIKANAPRFQCILVNTLSFSTNFDLIEAIYINVTALIETLFWFLGTQTAMLSVIIYFRQFQIPLVNWGEIKCHQTQYRVDNNRRDSFAVNFSLYYRSTTRNAFYKHGLTLIPAWKSNDIHYRVWNEITYSFPNFNGCTDVDVWVWISNFTPQFTGYACDYLTIHIGI